MSADQIQFQISLRLLAKNLLLFEVYFDKIKFMQYFN